MARAKKQGFRVTYFSGWALRNFGLQINVVTSEPTCPSTDDTYCGDSTTTQPATTDTLPGVTKCYTGTDLTAGTLTNQASNACSTGAKFCSVRKTENFNLEKKTLLWYFEKIIEKKYK